MNSGLTATARRERAPTAARRRRSERLYTTPLLALLGFAALAFAAARWPLRGPDHSLFGALYAGEWLQPAGSISGTPAVHDLLPLFSRIADLHTILLVSVAIAGFAALRGDRRSAWIVPIAVVAAGLASVLMAQLIARAAPYPVGGDGSFPSGHATAAAALAIAVVCVVSGTRAKVAAAIVGGTLVVFAGVAVTSDGGHWPSDVIGGWLLALASVTAIFARFGSRT